MEKVRGEGFYSLFKNLGGREDKFVVAFISSANLSFLPARRYASVGNSDRNVSVRLSVRLSRAGIVSKRRKLAA